MLCGKEIPFLADAVLWCELKATLIDSRGVFCMKEALHNTRHYWKITKKNPFMQLHKAGRKKKKKELRRVKKKSYSSELDRGNIVFPLFSNWPSKKTALLTKSHSKRFRGHIETAPG